MSERKRTNERRPLGVFRGEAHEWLVSDSEQDIYYPIDTYTLYILKGLYLLYLYELIDINIRVIPSCDQYLGLLPRAGGLFSPVVDFKGFWSNTIQKA